eukprot:574098-Pelagomonas_calceolata.AAC.2
MEMSQTKCLIICTSLYLGKRWSQDQPFNLDLTNALSYSHEPLAMRELDVDLRKRLRGVWNADALAEH